MFINITLKTGQQSADISIDSDQMILAVIKTLAGCGRLRLNCEPPRGFSDLNERIISTYKTFAQEEILSGDCLTIMPYNYRNG